MPVKHEVQSPLKTKKLFVSAPGKRHVSASQEIPETEKPVGKILRKDLKRASLTSSMASIASAVGSKITKSLSPVYDRIVRKSSPNEKQATAVKPLPAESDESSSSEDEDEARTIQGS